MLASTFEEAQIMIPGKLTNLVPTGKAGAQQSRNKNMLGDDELEATEEAT